jgi:hypothetical protein
MYDDDPIHPHSPQARSSSITPLHETYDDVTHPSHHISTIETFSVDIDKERGDNELVELEVEESVEAVFV